MPAFDSVADVPQARRYRVGPWTWIGTSYSTAVSQCGSLIGVAGLPSISDVSGVELLRTSSCVLHVSVSGRHVAIQRTHFWRESVGFRLWEGGSVKDKGWRVVWQEWWWLRMPGYYTLVGTGVGQLGALRVAVAAAQAVHVSAPAGCAAAAAEAVETVAETSEVRS